MASFAAMPEKPLHVRSTSMPSRPHPIALRVEEELHKLRNCAALSLQPTSSVTMEMMCNGLRGLGDLYNSIQDLLLLPSIQQGLFQYNQKMLLEKEVDQSIRLLDLCSTTKDSTAALKKHVQNLRYGLRRRVDSASGVKAHVYISTRKEAQNVIKCCCKDSMPLEKLLSLIDEVGDLSTAIKILIEAREVTISLLRSVLSFMSTPKPKPKASRWSFVSKAMHKSKAAAEEDSSLMGCIDIVSVFASHIDADGGRSLLAQNHLEACEVGLGDLENGLECLFRALIQNRASLLNILSL